MSHPKEILDSLKAAARKSLSQNFLTSPHWAETLVGRLVEQSSALGVEEVWEIGPGLGALTDPLLKASPVPVKVFEYDRKLAAYLREEYPGLDLIEGDFMDVDLEKLSPSAKKIAVLSNLPYHLSSPLLFKFWESPQRFVRLVFTFQKEFAERLWAQPQTKAYGALSVIIQSGYQLESVGVIPPGAFFPRPEVASEALRFHPIDRTVPRAALSRVVKAAFQQRRKKMLSNLKSFLPAAPYPEIFSRLGIDPSARAEDLPKEVFWQLTQSLLDSWGESPDR